MAFRDSERPSISPLPRNRNVLEEGAENMKEPDDGEKACEAPVWSG